ncbi:MAG: hypothetical protein H6865_04690 [Rhodospirillales bacterium]|nr:hypothetical protein [Alphaproteobacteria bacterium]MCB9986915.1 hypothetical protein [Rhodospirillales bacterium]USO08309.1 MAG: hypothetical protein H6866_03600 [Rhodospirillales bacterium]
MLMPAVNSYFAIYTLEGARAADTASRRGLFWDLHATATDRTLAISHARMLVLQPGVREVQVKQVTEDMASGQVSVRDVKRCRRGQVAHRGAAALAVCAGICALMLMRAWL